MVQTSYILHVKVLEPSLMYFLDTDDHKDWEVDEVLLPTKQTTNLYNEGGFNSIKQIEDHVAARTVSVFPNQLYKPLPTSIWAQ